MAMLTSAEMGLLEVLRAEPQLVENLRNCSAPMQHEREMLERLRVLLIRTVGAQRAVDLGGMRDAIR